MAEGQNKGCITPLRLLCDLFIFNIYGFFYIKKSKFIKNKNECLPLMQTCIISRAGSCYTQKER